MPTLLRLVLGAILFVFLMLAGAVSAFIGPASDTLPFAVWTVALTAFGLPALMGGITLSYWSWTGADGHRRRRRLLLLLAVIQLAGAVAMIASAAAVPQRLLATVVVVVVGFALDAPALAIGRAARRIEERRPRPTARVAPDLDREIRTGWRRGAIGAVVGLAVAVALGGGLSLLLDAGSTLMSVRGVTLAVSIALIGATFGMLTTSLQLSRRIRDELRGDSGTARRISRAMAGKPEALDPDEEEAAARYAAIALRWLPFQLTSSFLLLVSIATLQAGGVADDGLDPVRAASLGLLAVGVLVGVPMTVLRVRRLRTYAAAHPAS